MQPDPATFLRGIRRELLRGVRASEAGSNARIAKLIAERAAEGTSQLLFRMEYLPDILRDIRPQQMALLERSISLISEAGLPLPADTAFIPQGGALEPIETYETLARILAACMATLQGRAGTGQAEPADAMLVACCRLELQLQSSIESGIRLLSEQIDNAPPTSDELVRPPSVAELSDYFRRRFPAHKTIEVTSIEPLKGVNSNEVLFLELSGHPQWPRALVLRRDRHFSPAKSSVATEFEILDRLHHAGIPVARALMVERDPAEFQYPFLIMERVAGLPYAAQENANAAAGPAIAAQIARHLAHLHQLKTDELYVNAPALQRSPHERTIDMIERFHKSWTAEKVEPSLTIEAGFSWLRANVHHTTTDVSLVHGDYDLRNILIEGNMVTAILDWEGAHIGNPAEDLAYCKTDVEKIASWPEFLMIYEAAGGAKIPETTIRYFEVWSNVFRSVAAATGYCGYCSDIHRDFILGTVGFMEFPKCVARLATALERAVTAEGLR